MKFTIEVRSAGSGGSETVLRRLSVEAINPAGALKQAQALLAEWKRRRATRVRVLNALGDEVYSLPN